MTENPHVDHAFAPAVQTPSEALVSRLHERAWLRWQTAAIHGDDDELVWMHEVDRLAVRLQELRGAVA